MTSFWGAAPRTAPSGFSLDRAQIRRDGTQKIGCDRHAGVLLPAHRYDLGMARRLVSESVSP